MRVMVVLTRSYNGKPAVRFRDVGLLEDVDPERVLDAQAQGRGEVMKYSRFSLARRDETAGSMFVEEELGREYYVDIPDQEVAL